jgi:hypothetical protein
MNDLIYSHPKYGWGHVVAADSDDGAAKIFRPINPDGDNGDYDRPLYYVEMDQLTLVSQEEWDRTFPAFERKFPTQEEQREAQYNVDRSLYEFLKKKFETNN